MLYCCSGEAKVLGYTALTLGTGVAVALPVGYLVSAVWAAKSGAIAASYTAGALATTHVISKEEGFTCIAKAVAVVLWPATVVVAVGKGVYQHVKGEKNQQADADACLL